MSRVNLETQFKRFITDNFDGFFRRIEPGRGGDAGFPDLILGTAIGYVPVEIKIGTIDGDTLWTSVIRPAQLKFARESSEYGFHSLFIVGVQDGVDWRGFIFNSVIANQFDTIGFKIGADCFELPFHNLAAEIDSFCFGEFGE